MAISYGTITIIDNTDLGQLSAYLTTDKYKQQVLDENTNPATYYPDWIENDGWLTITPHVYHNGVEVPIATGGIANSNLEITWYEDDTNLSTDSSSSAAALSNNTCKRIANLTTSKRHVTYKANIKYYPVSGDKSLFLITSAEIELSLNTTGTDAAEPKSLQLSGTKAYFTYTYDGNIYGEHNSVLSVSKSSTIAGVVWYYTNSNGVETVLPNSLVTNGGGSNPFTGTSFTLSVDNAFQSALFESLVARGQISFGVKETTTSGGTTLVADGFTDYFSIFRYQQASPGDSVYTSFLDNDQETLSVYNNILDLTNAVSGLYINKNGQDDSENWHVRVEDNINDTTSFNYAQWNTKDYPSGIFKGVSSVTITNNGTQAPVINGNTIATSSLSANDLVAYNTSVFSWNGSKWILTTNNLNKFGPNKVVVTTMEVNSATITFISSHGSYSDTTFNQDTGDDATSDLINTFSISKSATVISHSLRLDTLAINRDSEGHYTPSQVTIDAITRSGGSTTPTAYRDAGVIKYTINYSSGNPTTGQNSANLPATIDLTNITREITSIVATLGASSPYEDTQTVVVTNDGSSPYNINLLNSGDTISTTYDYKPSNNYVIDVPFVVMQGIEEINVNYKVNANTAYPRVSVSVIKDSSTNTSLEITPDFYNGETKVTTATTVNKVKATLPSTQIIGQSGYFTLTFELNATISKTVTYKYVSSPEALNALSVYLNPTPGDTFSNQAGRIIVEPSVLDGVVPVTSNLKYQWEIYNNGWKILKNSALSGEETTNTYYYDNSNNIFFSNSGGADATIDESIKNNTADSKYLHVIGAGVDSYVAFRVKITYTLTNIVLTEYISLKDIDDPLQVTILSTIGTQLTNGQGEGVIYAKVVRNSEEIDAIASKLVFSSQQPTGSINTGDFAGMLGCIYKNGNSLTYYSRPNTSANWTLRSKTVASYSWSFRDKDNETILDTDLSDSSYLYYIIHNNVNTQFIYVDKNIVDKKMTADVRVTV